MTTGVEGTHFFALNDGGVLFSEPAQRLYALNAAAAYCWLALQDEVPEEQVAAELEAAGAPAGEGHNWWRQSVEIFRAEGFLSGAAGSAADLPPPAGQGLMNGQRLERLPPMALTRHYRLFDTQFR